MVGAGSCGVSVYGGMINLFDGGMINFFDLIRLVLLLFSTISSLTCNTLWLLA